MPLSLQSRYSISVEKQGPGKISKPAFPLRYGKYSEIRTSDYEFIFNLNGEIKFIRGLDPDWPHPAEQLKRTDGHDWVYYTVGDESGDTGLISWLGEYYMPCLPYPSNPVWESNYMAKPQVMNAFAAWSQMHADLFGAQSSGMPSKWKQLIALVLNNDERKLYDRSRQLQSIIGERISVLPPDTRHVDYEVIPLIIADGCLYHCRFCCIKSDRRFQRRSPNDIFEQIDRLKTFYGPNLENYNALFLGNHDALAAGSEMIELAATEAAEAFGFEAPGAVTPKLYM